MEDLSKKIAISNLSDILNISTKLTSGSPEIPNAAISSFKENKEWLSAALSEYFGSGGSRISKIVDSLKNIATSIKDESSAPLEVESIQLVLQDLNDYCCDIDSAIDFHNIYGFQILFEILEHPANDVKSDTLIVFSTILQNNTVVQEKSYSNEFLLKFITLWRYSLDKESYISSCAITVISSIVKNYPKAVEDLVGYLKINTIVSETLLVAKCQYKLLTLLNNMYFTHPTATTSVVDSNFFSTILKMELTQCICEEIIKFIVKFTPEELKLILNDKKIDVCLIKNLTIHISQTCINKKFRKNLGKFHKTVSTLLN